MARIDELKAWEAELVGEKEKIGRDLEPLLNQREQLIQKLELVQRLIAVESATPLVSTHPPLSQNVGTAPPSGNGGNQIQMAVREILEQHGKPMHIRDIRTALVGRGVAIPGKGTDANVIVHLRRAPEIFARKTRGTYSLKRKKNGT